MRTQLSLPIFIAAAALLAATPARAQAPDRVTVSINGGYRPTTQRFDDRVSPTQFVETATVDTAYRVKAAPQIDVGAAVRVWRRLAVGADIAYFTKVSSGTVSAQIPHPFYFGRPRAVGGDATHLNRREIAVHAQARWTLPL